MSASSRSTSSLPESRQFPGNCSLEMALSTIVDVFHRYSIRLGGLDVLNFEEFKKLLAEQTPTFLEACGRKNPEHINKMFKETDINKDKELTFEEFSIFLAKVTDDAHRIIHNEERCTPDKD